MTPKDKNTSTNQSTTSELKKIRTLEELDKILSTTSTVRSNNIEIFNDLHEKVNKDRKD